VDPHSSAAVGARAGTQIAGPMVGTAPINWNNDDLPGLRPRIPFPAILDEMAATGYAGTEYGSGFPTEAEALRGALAARNLRLCGSYQWLHLRDDDRLAAELAGLEQMLARLAALHCPHLIVADAMTEERITLAGHVPNDGSAGLSDDEWDRLARNLAAVATLAAGQGVRPHYHNHVGTYVETPVEVERLVRCLDGTGGDLCFDTGHYAYGGGDPNAFVARHRERIGYLHLKDVDPDVLAEARQQGWSFLDALASSIFCELGHGIVDVPAIVDALRAVGYQGWIVVEQDTTSGTPTESARANRDFLRERCGL
jgi:inosose dehydratase